MRATPSLSFALALALVSAACVFTLPEPREAEQASTTDASTTDGTAADGDADGGGTAEQDGEASVTSPDASTPCGTMPVVDLFVDPAFACWTPRNGAAPSLVVGEAVGGTAARFVVAKNGGRKFLQRTFSVPGDHNHVHLEMSVRIDAPATGYIKGPTLVFGGGAELAFSIFNRKLYCDGDPSDANDVPIGTVTATGGWQRVVVDVVDRAAGTTMVCSVPGQAEVTSPNQAGLGPLAALNIAAPLDETAVTFDIDTLELRTDHAP